MTTISRKTIGSPAFSNEKLEVVLASCEQPPKRRRTQSLKYAWGYIALKNCGFSIKKNWYNHFFSAATRNFFENLLKIYNRGFWSIYTVGKPLDYASLIYAFFGRKFFGICKAGLMKKFRTKGPTFFRTHKRSFCILVLTLVGFPTKVQKMILKHLEHFVDYGVEKTKPIPIIGNFWHENLWSLKPKEKSHSEIHREIAPRDCDALRIKLKVIRLERIFEKRNNSSCNFRVHRNVKALNLDINEDFKVAPRRSSDAKTKFVAIK